MISLKQKLKDNEVTIGSWITIPDPIIAEIMSKHFEWLVIDMEHSAITLDKCQDLIRIISLQGCKPFVRVGENSPYIIKRVLDAGAHGIIVPMVNSKEDAEKALSAVHYPPQGTRGVGLARAQDYGFGFDDYNHWQQTEPIVIAQIEHVDGARNLSQILQTDIDGIIVGPYDLSASLGRPGDFEDSIFKGWLKDITETAKKYHKPVGYHVIQPDHTLADEKIKQGYTFIAFSIDTLFLGTKIKEEMNEI
jgi:2-dehydro-3-deoxyglucarate aldolase